MISLLTGKYIQIFMVLWIIGAFVVRVDIFIEADKRPVRSKRVGVLMAD